MSGPITSPTPPDLRALLDGFKQEVRQSMNCALLGKVVAIQVEPEFVPRVSVQISSKRTLPNGNLVDYPLLTDCPVFTLMGGGAFILMPIAVGDSCLVLFHDTDIDNWWTTGDGGLPNTPRTHDLSDGIAFVGVPNMTTPVSGYDGGGMLFQLGLTSITIDPSSGVTITSASGVYIQLATNGDIKITNSAGAVVELKTTGKLNLSNGSGSLLSALDALATLLTGWVNTGGSTPNPATVAAIAAFKTSVDALLA